MKALLALLIAAFSLSAVAQKHMIEFNGDAFTFGKLSFRSDKSPGANSSEVKSRFVFVNYAYTIAPQIQVGTHVNYSKFKGDGFSQESYQVLAGAIYNFESDLRKSLYTSLYAGWEWDHDYTSPSSHDENFITKLSAGKRIPLSMFNLENVTYTPEVSFITTNRTKKTGTSSTEWAQELSFKFLQFSIFF